MDLSKKTTESAIVISPRSWDLWPIVSEEHFKHGRYAYVRSTAVWNFNLASGDYVIPTGAGIGKVFAQPDGATINVFAEPQWTITHRGAGQPAFQPFAGLNLQFPINKKP